MAEDSERRFLAVMDKLFHAPPKPNVKPSSTTTITTTISSSRGTKRPHMLSALAAPELKSRWPGAEELRNSSGTASQAPLCRPWDRADLLKRLATFKSMTWFAKPEAVSAVRCARSGWINVDADIIACESCGARLLFSTPSSWAQQQVEKAALVFSLKLNIGHKVHCPWVDNACDNMLAQFPPVPAVDLVDNYKKRSARLMLLVALPTISTASFDYKRNPQLEHFLNGPSTLEHGNQADASVTECIGNECEAITSILYYQAQKLISLCGWEPRSLPYIVECKDKGFQSSQDRSLSDPSTAVSNGQTSSINVFSSGAGDITDANEDPAASDVQYDPSSVVLDCSLCGASVGLWAFCPVPRPVEFIRLTGRPYSNDSSTNAHQRDNTNHYGTEASGANHAEGRVDVTSTAATGGTSSNGITLKLNLTIAGGPPPEKQNFRPKISFPVIGHNLRSQLSSESQLKDHISFKALTGGDMELRSQKETDIVENETPETTSSYSVVESLENINPVVYSSSTFGESSEKSSSAEAADPGAGNLSISQDGNISIASLSRQLFTENGETPLNVSSLNDLDVSDYLQQNPGAETVSSKQGDIQEGQGILAITQPVNNLGPSTLGKDLKRLSSANAMEFDPIRQHRHFCPWIASNGNSCPGWKQTLNALQRQKEFSSPLYTERPSSSLIEVDDPVGSVKKLFTPPSSKQKKLMHGSS